MTDTNPTPYANLTPELILDAVESKGLQCSGSLLALNSYENRVYQVGIEQAKPLIVKFYRPERWTDAAILEEHQCALELLDYEIPVVAPWQDPDGQTLHRYQDFRFAIFPRWGGRALEVDSNHQLEWMGRFIARIHAVGAIKKFAHRPKLTVQSHGFDALQFLQNNHVLPDYARDNYLHIANIVLEKIQATFQNIGPLKTLRIHGDMHAGNVLWDDHGPHILDLDDCMTGPAIQDLWMLLSGDKHHVEAQLELILRGYNEFHHFDKTELQLIEPLRTLRQINYSSWLAKRWHDPAFPISFPWFNTPRYWEEQIRNLHEQNELLNQ